MNFLKDNHILIKIVWEYLSTFKALHDVLKRSLNKTFEIVSPGRGVNKIGNETDRVAGQNKIIRSDTLQTVMIKAEYDALFQKAEDCKKTAESINHKNVQLQLENTNQAEKFTMVLEERNDLQMQHDRLESDLVDLKEKYKGMKEQLNANVDDVKSKLENCNTKVIAISRENDDLKETREELSRSLQEVRQEKEQLKQMHDDMLEQITCLENENQRLNNELQSMRQSLGKMEEGICNLKTLIKDMEKSHRETFKEAEKEHEKRLEEADRKHQERLEKVDQKYQEILEKVDRKYQKILENVEQNYQEIHVSSRADVKHESIKEAIRKHPERFNTQRWGIQHSKHLFKLMYKTQTIRTKQSRGQIGLQGFVYNVPDKASIPGNREDLMKQFRSSDPGCVDNPDFTAVAYRINMGEKDHPSCICQKYGFDKEMKNHTEMETIAEHIKEYLQAKNIYGCVIVLTKTVEAGNPSSYSDVSFEETSNFQKLFQECCHAYNCIMV